MAKSGAPLWQSGGDYSSGWRSRQVIGRYLIALRKLGARVTGPVLGGYPFACVGFAIPASILLAGFSAVC
jgi:hypothetical protein